MEAILYGTIAGLATIVGVLLMLRWRDWALRHSHFVNSLAAGLIVGVALLSLTPEALEMNPHAALPFLLAGFVLFYLIETVVVFHSGSEVHFHGAGDPHASDSKGYTLFAGLFLHSVVDGVVIGVGFEVSSAVGKLAAVSVILHELPEGVTTFALLANRLSQRLALWLSVAVALATTAGAAFGAFALRGAGAPMLGALLAVAAGSFLYVGAADLIPETHTRKGWLNAVFLAAGAFLAFLLSHGGH